MCSIHGCGGEIVDRVYDEIIANPIYSMKHFIGELDQAVAEALSASRTARRLLGACRLTGATTCCCCARIRPPPTHG